MPNSDPGHRKVEAAVQQWWNDKMERPNHSATWHPDRGIETFRATFDPDGKLGDLGGVFTAHTNGNLLVTWAGQTHLLTPGSTWTYRPRRTRQLLTSQPAEHTP